MLLIQQHQMDKFGEHAEQAFQERLAILLDETGVSPGQVSGSEVRSFVERLVASARGYDLVSEQEIAVFVLLAWLHGPSFDKENPQVESILGAFKLASDEKLDQLTRWSVQNRSERIRGKDLEWA